MPNIRESGLPVLHGPYVVDHTDIPHNGDTKVLWTPEVGDVLLRLIADWSVGTVWDHGRLYIGQGVDGTATPPTNVILEQLNYGTPGDMIALSFLDNIWQEQIYDASGGTHGTTAYFFHSADPVQVQLAHTGGTDPTTGHVALYALIARALAP